jgi:hypothetical protein
MNLPVTPRVLHLRFSLIFVPFWFLTVITRCAQHNDKPSH